MIIKLLHIIMEYRKKIQFQLGFQLVLALIVIPLGMKIRPRINSPKIDKIKI